MNSTLLLRKMDEKGLSPKSLADQLGLSESYMKQIIRGLRPSPPTLRLMALVLGCKSEELSTAA